MSERRKNIKATSPKGTIMWFSLTKPDPKFKKYKVDLVVDDTPELRKIMEQVESEAKAAFEELVAKTSDLAKRKKLKMSDNKPIEEQLDSQGNPTGKFVMKFRAKSEGVNKDKEVYSIPAPALFNAQAKPISAEEKASLRVFNGSIGQVNFEIVRYGNASLGAGATLQPKACMIHKIQQAAPDASQFGFSASELDPSDTSDDVSSDENVGVAPVDNDDF